MNTDYRMKIGFAKNRKTRRLAKRAGVDGILGLHALFEYTALNRPTGDLSGLTDEKITDICEYDDGNFAEILRETGWLDGEAGACVVHEWAEHQPFAAAAQMRSERARKGGEARQAAMTDEEKAAHAKKMVEARTTSLGENKQVVNVLIASQNGEKLDAQQAPSPSPTPSPNPEGLYASSGHEAEEGLGEAGADKSGAKPKRKKSTPVHRPEDFERCYVSYDKPIERIEAVDEWDKYRPDAGEVDAILAFIVEAKKSDRWRKGFKPSFGRFVNKQRWTDSLSEYSDIPRPQFGQTDTSPVFQIKRPPLPPPSTPNLDEIFGGTR